MKGAVLAVALFLGAVLCEDAPYPASGQDAPYPASGQDAPYPASGWKPQGALLVLPKYGPPTNESADAPITTLPPPLAQDGSDLEKVNENVMDRLRQEEGSERGVYYVYLPDGRLQRVQYTSAPIKQAPAPSTQQTSFQQTTQQSNHQVVFGSHQTNAQGNFAQYQNGASNQYQNGASNQYQNGASNQYRNGASNQYRNDASNQYQNGASNQYQNGATNQYQTFGRFEAQNANQYQGNNQYAAPAASNADYQAQAFAQFQAAQSAQQSSAQYQNGAQYAAPAAPSGDYQAFAQFQAAQSGQYKQTAAKPQEAEKAGDPSQIFAKFTAPKPAEQPQPAKLQEENLPPTSYVASVQYTDVAPIVGPIYSYNPSPLVRVVRYAANFQ